MSYPNWQYLVAAVVAAGVAAVVAAVVVAAVAGVAGVVVPCPAQVKTARKRISAVQLISKWACLGPSH